MARKDKYDYFKAFANQLEIAMQEADLLIDIIDNFTDAESVGKQLSVAHDLENKADVINHDTFQAIAADFITPIDRDDILDLAHAIDDIVDYTEDVIRQLYIYDVHFMHYDLRGMAVCIRKSCAALREAMDEFPNFKKSEKFKQILSDVNSFEEEADRLYDEATHKLFTVDKENPMRVIVWSRIFIKVEKCNDACEHVADIMGNILAKNS